MRPRQLARHWFVWRWLDDCLGGGTSQWVALADGLGVTECYRAADAEINCD